MIRCGATDPTGIPKAERRSSSAILWTVAHGFSTPCGWFATWSSTGSALCVPGNHDMKFMRKLQGRDVQVKHGLAQSVAEVEALPEDVRQQFTKEAAEFIDGLISHYVLDGGKLVVAHAGMKAEMQGRGSGKVREFALYGETTGETDEFGLPVRYNWAAEYRGRATVVYGHTPVPEPEWLNRTTNIDTGCVFGGKLTALRWPEREFVSVPAARTYCEPARPFLPDAQTHSAAHGQQIHDDLLDAEDVLGKRIISTRLRSSVTIREENAMAASGDHEPLCRQPEVADLPAAHDVAVRNERPGRLSRIPDRGVLVLSVPGRLAGRVRREAHGLPCRGHRLPERRGGSAAVRRSSARRRGSSTTRTGRRFFTDGESGGAVARPDSGRHGRQRLLDAVQHRLGLPRLRIDALVGQGPGASALAVRRRGRFRAGHRCPRPWPRSGRLPNGWPSGESSPARASRPMLGCRSSARRYRAPMRGH